MTTVTETVTETITTGITTGFPVEITDLAKHFHREGKWEGRCSCTEES